MKKTISKIIISKIMISMLLCLVFVSGCGNENQMTETEKPNKTIKIAVFENSGSQQEYFRKGIKKAYNDVKEEYKDSGYTIECNFYGISETYERALDITVELVKDPSLTAIIGSDSETIYESQAITAQENKKILVGPGWVEDEIMTAENNMIFSVTNSNEDMAAAVKCVTDELPVTNWAVCTSKDDIGIKEAQNFRKKDAVNVLDYCDIDDLGIYYDRVKERWESLDIDGVVLLPYNNEGFEYLYKLKEDMPDLYVVADFDMDNQTEYEKHKNALKNLYIISGFYIDEDKEILTEKYGFEDTWEVHGYNTFRMLVDTAVKNETTDPVKIADILHTYGYEGVGESFEFEKNGLPITKKYSFVNMDTMEEYLIDSKREGKTK